MTYDRIIVLDFGSQYNQLIVRRIREFSVYSELYPYDTPATTIAAMANVRGIILSGGPRSVYDADAFRGDSALFGLGIPILGICYGMQWITDHFGGTVRKSDQKEYGKKAIDIIHPCPLTTKLPVRQNVWMSHGDHVAAVPEGFQTTAISETGIPAIIVDSKRRIFGVQFHPEVRHTEFGTDLLKNFVFSICQAAPGWTMAGFVDEAVASICARVGTAKVLMAISGGVDSSVAAVLIHKAIGDRLQCIFVDHGLLRLNEGNAVMQTFAEVYGIDVIRIDAQDRFLSRLAGVTDPEKKRKIIGTEFVRVFEEEAAKRGDFAFLGQGTLYTDVIESGTKTAQKIKSHHNVGGLPEGMRFVLLEPLDRLFKDEVRSLGKELGIHPDIVGRQPFPGPGLAIRIIGEITSEKLTIVRESDAILREEIHKAGLEGAIWQYFTAVPGFRSVGVMGDQRTYSEAVVIRAVTSADGMTADWAKIPPGVLDVISRRIVNEVKGCNRVLFDITSKPPATIEYE